MINFPFLFSKYSFFSHKMLYASLGFMLFTFVYFIFGPPVKTYVIEHEFTHIIFAFLSGVKVKSVSFNSRNSHVKTEKVNIAIALAPYSFPLYTLIIILFYKIISNFYKSNIFSTISYFLIGVSLAFHIVVTIHYIQIDQPDMKKYGYISSLVFILSWSIVVLSGIFALMFDRVELISFYKISFYGAENIYKKILSIFI